MLQLKQCNFTSCCLLVLNHVLLDRQEHLSTWGPSMVISIDGDIRSTVELKFKARGLPNSL